jgi:hypothetical protein
MGLGPVDQAIEAVRVAGGGELDLARCRPTRVRESVRHLPGVTG